MLSLCHILSGEVKSGQGETCSRKGKATETQCPARHTHQALAPACPPTLVTRPVFAPLAGCGFSVLPAASLPFSLALFSLLLQMTLMKLEPLMFPVSFPPELLPHHICEIKPVSCGLGTWWRSLVLLEFLRPSSFLLSLPPLPPHALPLQELRTR